MNSTKVHKRLMAWLLVVGVGNGVAQQQATSPASPASVVASSDGYTLLREGLSNSNRDLASSVEYQKASAKRNAELLKEAQALDFANRKLREEKKRLLALGAELDKQRAQLASALDASEGAK